MIGKSINSNDVLRRSFYDFFEMIVITACLFGVSLYTHFHLFYLQYYCLLVSVVYFRKVVFKYIVLNDKGIKIFYGVFNTSSFEVNWESIEKIILTRCKKTEHFTVGGLTAFQVNEKSERLCLKFVLSKSVDRSFFTSINSSEVFWDDVANTLVILKEPHRGFLKLIGQMAQFKSVETTQKGSRREKYINRILSFYSLFLCLSCIIGLLLWIVYIVIVPKWV